MKETLTHHTIKGEWVTDESGPAIIIEQAGIEPVSVILHPWQLVAICKHFGLTAADAGAQKAIRTLQRRLVALDERIQDLLHHMANYSDHDHADLTTEMERLKALADLSGEWVAEMQDVAAEPEAACTEPAQQELAL